MRTNTNTYMHSRSTHAHTPTRISRTLHTLALSHLRVPFILKMTNRYGKCDVCGGPLFAKAVNSPVQSSNDAPKPKNIAPFFCHRCGVSYVRIDRLLAHAHVHTSKKVRMHCHWRGYAQKFSIIHVVQLNLPSQCHLSDTNQAIKIRVGSEAIVFINAL